MVSAIISPFFHKITLRIVLTKLESLERLFLAELDDALDERIRKVDEVIILLSPTHRFSTGLGDIINYFSKGMPRVAARGIVMFAYSEGTILYPILLPYIDQTMTVEGEPSDF